MSEELRDLSRDLGKVPTGVKKRLSPIFRKTALQIKKRMQSDLRGSSSFRVVANSVDYDLQSHRMFGSGVMTAEIGPNKSVDASAALAGFAYFGGVRGGGGTVADPEYIMHDEADTMVGFIGQAAGELW